MDGVLNETTKTIHKHEPGRSDFRTICGATSHVAHDQLRLISIDRSENDAGIERCGRCFSEAGGY
ncbi:hypothetical protein [Natronococcus wangiae]|uniref:hypothetical protein n=1 Tax=Natronococcus wangiae TaxID=3068275 RepID=UPI00273DB1E4|nr:hypothetical protein [Natronococcus sp. AD5]